MRRTKGTFLVPNAPAFARQWQTGRMPADRPMEGHAVGLEQTLDELRPEESGAGPAPIQRRPMSSCDMTDVSKLSG